VTILELTVFAEEVLADQLLFFVWAKPNTVNTRLNNVDKITFILD
jgi:hypothetical protein